MEGPRLAITLTYTGLAPGPRPRRTHFRGRLPRAAGAHGARCARRGVGTGLLARGTRGPRLREEVLALLRGFGWPLYGVAYAALFGSAARGVAEPPRR